MLDQYINLYNQNYSLSKISKIYNINRHNLSILLKDLIVNKRRRKYFPNHNYFNNIDSEEKAYILGFIFADGNVYKNRIKIEISNIDKDILILISNQIYNQDLVKYSKKNNKDYCSLSIYSENIKNDLAKYSCVSNKSKILIFPNINEIYYKHFIRGLIDGDGFISLKTKTIGLLATNNINQYIKSILNKLNISCFIVKAYKQDINILNELRVKKQDSIIKLINYLYDNSTIFINRKYINALEIKKALQSKA